MCIMIDNSENKRSSKRTFVIPNRIKHKILAYCVCVCVYERSKFLLGSRILTGHCRISNDRREIVHAREQRCSNFSSVVYLDYLSYI
jgi:hypothetical protein